MNMGSGTYRPETMAKVLFAVAVLLGAATFVKVVGFFVASSKARVVAAQTRGGTADANDLKKSLAQAQSSVDQLKKKNLFIWAAPKQHPVSTVSGILGSEVLIGDKWYKAGESVGDAKIVAVEPTKVRIAWDGQEREFAPITSGGPGGPPGPPVGPGEKRGSPGGAPMVVTGARGGSAGERNASLSAEEREKMREQWANMSPEERQRSREEKRQKLGRRGP
jgi:hypothetical protein